MKNAIDQNNLLYLAFSILDNYCNSLSRESHNAISLLLNDNNCSLNDFLELCKQDKHTLSKFDTALSTLNEKSNQRKQKGVYYTPNDVAEYIAINSFLNYGIDDNNKVYNFDDGLKRIYLDKSVTEKVLNAKIIDPTCGTGVFLLNAFKIKITLLKKLDKIDDKHILKVIKTLYGNDIDNSSNDITKFRLLLESSKYISNKDSFTKIVECLNMQFYQTDFVCCHQEISKKFDIILGNPPYVEYRAFNNKALLKNKFGNVYADVIKNSLDILKNGGTLGFIIPLSYTSTPRMSKIRNCVDSCTSKKFVLNYADRPDCLFAGVHQKLSILICKKGNSPTVTYTSNYKHWYKQERKEILNGRSVFQNYSTNDMFIPKIGNDIENSIFSKVYTNSKHNIFDMQNGNETIFLNMRGCFWIKAFSFNPGSNEYKQLNYAKNMQPFVYCILNSSLFWLYWTIMSDCWHITTKELQYFKIPKKTKDTNIYRVLANKLEHKLEKTKKYVGTKQVDFEYKHKYCKDIIDEIDNQLSIDFKLSPEETNYVQTFAFGYRTGVSNA